MIGNYRFRTKNERAAGRGETRLEIAFHFPCWLVYDIPPRAGMVNCMMYKVNN